MDIRKEHNIGINNTIALSTAIKALTTLSEIEKCIDFHKLDKADDDELSGFESFVIEQVKGGE